jgi:hypothetical protein
MLSPEVYHVAVLQSLWRLVKLLVGLALAVATGVAASADCRVIPLKVSDRELVMPPHLRRLYRESLGDPALLDLRGRKPVRKLEELVTQMRDRSRRWAEAP